MGGSISGKDQKRVLRQIKKYSALKPKYRKYAALLKVILENGARAVTPFYFIQAREKGVPNFAGKVLRKLGKYHDPLIDMTDLCGARVIVQTQEQVKAVCDYIEKMFTIDKENSLDVSQRLKTTEFGYRSIHYIVQLKEGSNALGKSDLKIPGSLFGLKAEIQVRTFLEHSWADFCHEAIYKADFSVPEKWQREGAALAATLEQVDRQFSHIIENIGRYSSSYGTYMTEGEIIEKVDQLEFVLKYDKENVALVNQIGQMKIALGDYKSAIQILSTHADSRSNPILRNLGLALTRCYSRTNVKYRKGLKYLNAAMEQGDADAIAIFASLTKSTKSNREIRCLYQRSYEIAPSNPTYLANYLEYEIVCQKNISITGLLKPNILDAIKLSRDHADVKLNLPGAFFDMGKLYFLIGKPYESLWAYTSALHCSNTRDCKNILTEHLNSIRKLKIIKGELEGYEWIYRLLLIGSYVRFPSDRIKKELMSLATKGAREIVQPVIILAGGCDPDIDGKIHAYRSTLLSAFEHFHGTVVSGGTTIGISKVASNLKQKYGSDIYTIGYVPRRIPSKISVNFDREKLNEIRRTEGQDFSPLEPLQNWIDLLSSGVTADTVKIIGVNGGLIAAIEYRVALALGAKVGLIEKSGREADKLLDDKDWASAGTLLRLPNDMMTIKVFLRPPVGAFDNKKKREVMAQAVHEAYRREQIHNVAAEDPAMAEWRKLNEGYKNSNRQQVDHIVEKLSMVNCEVVPAKGGDDRPELMPDEIEMLARFEHGRWMVEKLANGWRYGPKKNMEKKTHPCLVPWHKLPPREQDKDYQAARKIPSFLADGGLKIRRISK